MTDPKIHTRYCEMFYSSGAAVSHADSGEEIKVGNVRDKLDLLCQQEAAGISSAPRFVSTLWSFNPTFVEKGCEIAKAAVLKENPDPVQNRRVLIVTEDFMSWTKNAEDFDAIYVVNDDFQDPYASLQEIAERMKSLGIAPEELTLGTHGRGEEGNWYAPPNLCFSPSPLEKFVDENTDLSFFPSENLKLIRTTACWMTRSMAQHIAKEWSFTGEFIFGSGGVNYYDKTGKNLSASRFPILDLRKGIDLFFNYQTPFGIRQNIIFVNGRDATEFLNFPLVLEDEKGLFTQSYSKAYEGLEYTGWDREVKAELLNRLILHLGPEADEIYSQVPQAIQLMEETNWNFHERRLYAAPHLILTSFLLEMSEKAKSSGNMVLSEEYVQMAFELNPRDASIPFASSEMYLKSLKAWERVLEKNPESLYATFALGITCKYLGDLDKAKTWLKKANQMNPAHLDTLFALDALYANEGKGKEVVELYRKCAEKNPSGESYYRLAEVLLENSSIDETYLHEAVSYYNRAMQENFRPSRCFTALQKIAKLFNQQKKVHEVIFCYELLRKREPQNVSILTPLGWAYWQSGDLEQARECWEEGIKISPENETLLSDLKLAHDPKFNHGLASAILKIVTWLEEL